jgi:hypothetical protein
MTVEASQASGVLRSGPVDWMALSAWGIVHGFVILLIEGQIPHTILEQKSLRELLEFQLEQVMLKK